MAGRLGIDGQILRLGGVAGLGDGCLPVELRHAQLFGAVAGVALPVVGLRLAQFADGAQTVGQSQQFLVVSLLIGVLYLSEGPCMTFIRWFPALTGCQGEKRCCGEHQCKMIDSFHVVIVFSFIISGMD